MDTWTLGDIKPCNNPLYETAYTIPMGPRYCYGGYFPKS